MHEHAFEDHWLAQYPYPSCCIHDNDGEFTVVSFLHMLTINDIKDETSTIKNQKAMSLVNNNIQHTVAIFEKYYITLLHKILHS